ncbi:PREDICTED: uncharacterized protein LOC109150802 [Ipomoea nil]|uniref:uncharacterized protein LOC109150802 n=1 Tax=Ipomoea nil TaxID=35883 RepID=UPI000901B11C|nr:PREDICTED: uncharacterized protein LOC109150802 [Ipomoea nil]
MEGSGETPELGQGNRNRGTAELAREVRDLQRKVEGRGDRPTARSLLSASPFSMKIQEYRAPRDFKCLTMPTYDGTGDPSDHLVGFQEKMMVIGAEDPMYCRAFFSTLDGAAQRWFLSLTPGSIDRFETLPEQFLTYFAGCMKTKKHFMTLTAIQQGETETLKEFLKRWQKEVQVVEDLDDRTALTLFMEALRSGDLFTSLRRETPDTYAQAVQRANRYAETEEALQQKIRREAKRPRDKTRTRPSDRPTKREERSNVIRGPPLPRHRAVATLGARHVHEVQPPRPTENLPPPPTKAEERPAAGRARYCRYHRSTGHSTEEYYPTKRNRGAYPEKTIDYSPQPMAKTSMGTSPEPSRRT